MISRRALLIAVAVVLVLVDACVTVRMGENIDDYRGTVKKLQAQLAKNPNDAEALRDLGVIYFQTSQFARAAEYLKRSSAAGPRDPKTLFYYGMALEYQDNKEGALAVYLNYADASSLSPYRKLMEGRYRQLTRDIIQKQLRALLAREDSLTDKKMAPRTVAVFPIVFQGTEGKFAALGTGLSELMISDLGQVRNLVMVERVRVEALLQELNFGASKFVDPATAPRLGRLLGSGRMVAGTFNVSGGNRLRVDVASYDVPGKKFPDPTSQSDALENLFTMEKDLVFGVIKQMGITLTAAEREKIQLIPTKNLQAFLAYSIGLERQDAGDFRGAAAYFKEAVALDPGFARAKAKADEADALSTAGGSRENALAVAQRMDPPTGPDMAPERPDLLQSRFRNLGDNIGSGFMPGQENRKAPEQAAASGAAVGDLPDPPPPPNR